MQMQPSPTAGSDQQQQQQQPIRDKTVNDALTSDKRRLVEVPYTASLAHTMNALVANHVVAVPVAAPPGHWIGAGGSMILEADKQTGAVRKHYIGMITMLDILAHIAGDNPSCTSTTPPIELDESTLEQRMSVPVSSVIGHCLESLSLWTLNANTSILDCMEVFSKGIHRALVPVDGNADNPTGVELVDSASGYRMLTQMDLLRFLKTHEDHLKPILSHSVAQAGGVNDVVFGVTAKTKVIDAIKCMRSASLNAVPIFEVSDQTANEDDHDDHTQLINGKGRKLVGTFSSTDLRECPMAQMHLWLTASVLDFTEILGSIGSSDIIGSGPPRELVTCRAETPLSEVIEMAVSMHVHRIWVVAEADGCLQLDGLVSLTDLIKVIRAAVLAESS